MGAAFSLKSPALLGRPLFPHVLCKGCSVSFHLDPTAPPWYPVPTGFAPLAALSSGQLVCSTFAPTSHTQWEVRPSPEVHLKYYVNNSSISYSVDRYY